MTGAARIRESLRQCARAPSHRPGTRGPEIVDMVSFEPTMLALIRKM